MIMKEIKKIKEEIDIVKIFKICLIIIFPVNVLMTVVYYSFFDDTVERAVKTEVTKLMNVTDNKVVVNYRKINNVNFIAEIIVEKDDNENIEALRRCIYSEGYIGRESSDKNGSNRFMWKKGEQERYYITEIEDNDKNNITFEIIYRTGKKTLIQELF